MSTLCKFRYLHHDVICTGCPNMFEYVLKTIQMVDDIDRGSAMLIIPQSKATHYTWTKTQTPIRTHVVWLCTYARSTQPVNCKHKTNVIYLHSYSLVKCGILFPCLIFTSKYLFGLFCCCMQTYYIILQTHTELKTAEELKQCPKSTAIWKGWDRRNYGIEYW